MSLRVEVVTPDRPVYRAEAKMVIARGVVGELGILPHHVPLVTELRIAPLRVIKEGDSDELAVHGGFLEVDGERLIVLAETAEQPDEIDVARAQEAYERAQETLRSPEADEAARAEAQRALQRAEVRLRVAGAQHHSA